MKVLPYKQKEWKGCRFSKLRKIMHHRKKIVYCSLDNAICTKEVCSVQYRDCDIYKRREQQVAKFLERRNGTTNTPIIEEKIPLATDEGYIPV